MKGPAEKTMFPTVSQTTNPFQILPQFLLILGKKIDSASAIKAGHLGMTWNVMQNHVHEFHVMQDKLEPYKSQGKRPDEQQP